MIIFETDEFKKVAQNALLFCETFPQCVVAYRWGARDDDLIVGAFGSGALCVKPESIRYHFGSGALCVKPESIWYPIQNYFRKVT